MRRVLVGAAILALLPWLWAGSVDAAGQDKQPSTVSGSSEAVKTTDYVGSETCNTCHGDLSKEFASNPHTRLALMHGGKGVTCES
jgi:hypothetical protein